MITLWHNPRCSKSRAALKLLQDAGADVHEYRYLETPPSQSDVTSLLSALALPAGSLLRKGEKVAKELGLTADTPERLLIEAMAANPILIERPIAVKNGRAIIGRPPEDVAKLL